MTIVLEPTYSQRRWARRQEPLSKELVTSPSPNHYHRYYSQDEQFMFWLGFLAGYRKAEALQKGSRT